MKSRKWTVTYETKDRTQHELTVNAKNQVHAVQLVCKKSRSLGQRWFRAVNAWPYDTTMHLPGMKHEAMAHKEKKK